MVDKTPDLQRLRFKDRFHVRLTALYASVVVTLVVAPMAFMFYELGSASQLKALQRTLLTTAVSIATSVDGDRVAAFKSAEASKDPYYLALSARTAQVLRADPSIYSVYILLPTQDPGTMTFAFNADSARSQAAVEPSEDVTVGETYEVARFPKLISGLKAPQVEDELHFDDWTLTISGYAPVRTAAGKVVGVLGVDVDGQPVAAMRRRVLVASLAVALGGLVLFALGGVLVGRNIRRPLEQLIDATGRVAGGDLQTDIASARRDEFGVVAGHFNQMVKGLRQREHIRATFGRYVSEDVAAALLAEPDSTALGGEVRHVTILFSDLRGYSTISEQLAPKEIVDLLNRYFGAMTELLDQHGGVVIEFLGDAILAVFGAPNDMQHHAGAAVQCAIEMRARLSELNTEWVASGLAVRWQQVGLESLGQRIGIHTGDVVAGNLGSELRTKYAVIGDTVNLAARLEQLNKEVESDGILISGEVVDELDDGLKAQCRHVISRTVKGREANVEVWAC